MKTTTNTGRNQKIRRKVREDSFDANKIIRVSLQTLSMIYGKSLLFQKGSFNSETD